MALRQVMMGRSRRDGFDGPNQSSAGSVSPVVRS